MSVRAGACRLWFVPLVLLCASAWSDPVTLAETRPGMPRIAIIIDDLGNLSRNGERVVALDAPVACSILPHTPYAVWLAKRAHAVGKEVMLHLPLQSVRHHSHTPGTLKLHMTHYEFIRQLRSDIESVPHIKGINNHMGSRLTAESNQLYQIFSILKKRGLFFVDSRTTAKTLCKPSARMFKVPFAQRDVFLDHKQKPEFIRKQIKALIETARRQGQAVGIAHPYSTTYTVLNEMLPELKQNVQMVPASQIVRIIG